MIFQHKEPFILNYVLLVVLHLYSPVIQKCLQYQDESVQSFLFRFGLKGDDEVTIVD